MKTKAITFEEYAVYKKGNEDKSYGEIFDLAWKNSQEGRLRQKYNQNIVRFLSIGGTVLLVSTFVLSPSTKAFADVLGMQKLAQEESFIVYKLKIASEFYKNCLGILGLDNYVSLFVDIIKEALDPGEIYTFVEAAKGLSLEELIQLIPTL